jgi:aerobic-type carbon monoxide dehydrogenase small subunit (CoxS/CutS family)
VDYVPAGGVVLTCDPERVRARAEELVSTSREFLEASWVNAAMRGAGEVGGEMHPLQDEFSAKQGLQCGYCTPGMLMRACEILARNPDPSPAEVREAIASNLCRCTGYQYITEAVVAAAARMRSAKEVAQ